MGSLALAAKAMGHRVTGSDTNVYPPMSTQLEQAGITIVEVITCLNEPAPDLVIVGNACLEAMPVSSICSRKLPYTSGPQWLGYATAKKTCAICFWYPWQNIYKQYVGKNSPPRRL